MVARRRNSRAHTTQRLEIDDGGSKRRFSFSLCRNKSQFGDVPIDQFWMDHSTVYGQRNSHAVNYEAIVEYFWSLCRREGSELDGPVQESYMLASLLPEARSNGSRRVFEDAVPQRATVAHRQRLLHALDQHLAAGRESEVDIVSFRDQTAKLLTTSPSYAEGVWNCYRQYEQELFGEGRGA